jgi:hypothetical protein
MAVNKACCGNSAIFVRNFLTSVMLDARRDIALDDGVGEAEAFTGIHSDAIYSLREKGRS